MSMFLYLTAYSEYGCQRLLVLWKCLLRCDLKSRKTWWGMACCPLTQRGALPIIITRNRPTLEVAARWSACFEFVKERLPI